MKLQVNTAGAWKAVVEFHDDRRVEVIKALHMLDTALGSSAKWCLVDAAGKREWLDMPEVKP